MDATNPDALNNFPARMKPAVRMTFQSFKKASSIAVKQVPGVVADHIVLFWQAIFTSVERIEKLNLDFEAKIWSESCTGSTLHEWIMVSYSQPKENTSFFLAFCKRR